MDDNKESKIPFIFTYKGYNLTVNKYIKDFGNIREIYERVKKGDKELIKVTSIYKDSGEIKSVEYGHVYTKVVRYTPNLPDEDFSKPISTIKFEVVEEYPERKEIIETEDNKELIEKIKSLEYGDYMWIYEPNEQAKFNARLKEAKEKAEQTAKEQTTTKEKAYLEKEKEIEEEIFKEQELKRAKQMAEVKKDSLKQDTLKQKTLTKCDTTNFVTVGDVVSPIEESTTTTITIGPNTDSETIQSDKDYDEFGNIYYYTSQRKDVKIVLDAEEFAVSQKIEINLENPMKEGNKTIIPVTLISDPIEEAIFKLMDKVKEMEVVRYTKELEEEVKCVDRYFEHEDVDEFVAKVTQNMINYPNFDSNGNYYLWIERKNERHRVTSIELLEVEKVEIEPILTSDGEKVISPSYGLIARYEDREGETTIKSKVCNIALDDFTLICTDFVTNQYSRVIVNNLNDGWREVIVR